MWTVRTLVGATNFADAQNISFGFLKRLTVHLVVQKCNKKHNANEKNKTPKVEFKIPDSEEGWPPSVQHGYRVGEGLQQPRIHCEG